mmetsp:Transcript_4867/g.7223  ORF Transcript_4867/g.7223 Transcript_4867/m.7223 type:complete len:397 (+) Transcript_4867:114-1304(+)
MPRFRFTAAPKCEVCQKRVYQMEMQKWDEKFYHKNCFRCLECNKTLVPKSVAMMSGDLYCKGCFKKKFKARGKYDDITTVIPGKQKNLGNDERKSARRFSVSPAEPTRTSSVSPADPARTSSISPAEQESFMTRRSSLKKSTSTSRRSSVTFRLSAPEDSNAGRPMLRSNTFHMANKYEKETVEAAPRLSVPGKARRKKKPRNSVGNLLAQFESFGKKKKPKNRRKYATMRNFREAMTKAEKEGILDQTSKEAPAKISLSGTVDSELAVKKEAEQKNESEQKTVEVKDAEAKADEKLSNTVLTMNAPIKIQKLQEFDSFMKDVPELNDDEVLIKSLAFNLNMFACIDNNGDWKFERQNVLTGTVAGLVVKSSNPKFAKGQVVKGNMKFQTYNVANG